MPERRHRLGLVLRLTLRRGREGFEEGDLHLPDQSQQVEDAGRRMPPDRLQEHLVGRDVCRGSFREPSLLQLHDPAPSDATAESACEGLSDAAEGVILGALVAFLK